MIGTKLKNLRESKNITQKFLSEHLGFSARNVSHWETDRSQPDLVSLKALCEYYDVSADYLIGLSKSKKGLQLDEEQAQLIDIISTLSPDEKRHLSIFIEFLLYSRKSEETPKEKESAVSHSRNRNEMKPASKNQNYAVEEDAGAADEVAENSQGFPKE